MSAQTTTRRKMDVCRFVGVCMGCEHWQVDVTARARSEHGGQDAAMWAVAEAHNEHVQTECPRGTEGRVLFNGQWVEPIKMGDGTTATASMAMHPLPRWWVSR